jgi:hypothetical protein
MYIEQKHQALQAAQLAMSQWDFDQVCVMLLTLTSEDLQRVADEEEKGGRATDSQILVL